MTRTPVHDALTPETPTLDRAESGRHRKGAGLGAGHPATWLTTAIAVATVGVAGYVATSAGESPDALRADAQQAQASLSGAVPGIASSAVESARDSLQQQRTAQGWRRIGRTVEGFAAVQTSQQSAAVGASAAQARSEQIAAARAAAEQEAAAQAAEAAAAQHAADDAAAQEAAAEEAAADEEAAAAERQAEQESASRSQERAEAPEPTYEPEPEPAPVSAGDPRSIARSMLGSYGWSSDQFGCLESLWSKESGWNTYAQNASSGAYGIPQSLPGDKMASAGSDWRSNPATQIRWGLGYISGRYGSPCGAWSHSQANNWY